EGGMDDEPHFLCSCTRGALPDVGCHARARSDGGSLHKEHAEWFPQDALDGHLQSDRDSAGLVRRHDASTQWDQSANRFGAGATDGPVNGKGNLIVGYDANTGGHARTGSHNLVVGDEHTYSSYGGLVTGSHNSVLAPGASVTGGGNNTASAEFASVSGGVN